MIISDKNIGDIEFVKSSRVRRLSIKVDSKGMVRVVVPSSVSYDVAMDFVTRKYSWILKHIERHKDRKTENIITPLFSTRRHTLSLNPCVDGRFGAVVRNGIITVAYPAVENFSSQLVQDMIKKGVCEAWRIEALELLPERVKHIASACGLSYNRVSVRNSTGRWGSCSSENNISLSLQLMMLPDYLVDYVILHELCHTVHRNHGEKFHQLLDKLSDGNHSQYRKELKSYFPLR